MKNKSIKPRSVTKPIKVEVVASDPDRWMQELATKLPPRIKVPRRPFRSPTP
jgi:hypothetical protein